MVRSVRLKRFSVGLGCLWRCLFPPLSALLTETRPSASQDDEFPSDQVKFGREVLVIDTWSKKRLYDFLASVSPRLRLHIQDMSAD